MDEYLTNFRDNSMRKILGRDEMIHFILGDLDRPEIPNVAILGNAGVGKTALVRAVARQDTSAEYFEIDLSRMASSMQSNVNGSEEIGPRLKMLFDEVQQFERKFDIEIVLFMDEIHAIVQQSTAAVQALKPLLAESGRHNTKVIVATTLEEFNQYIKPDAALTQRLQPIMLEPPKSGTVKKILRSFHDKYVPNAMISDNIYDEIIKYTNQYLPSEVQPRKSIRVLDGMVGQYNRFKTPLDEANLRNVLQKSFNISIDQHMDIKKIVEYLNNRVIDQKFATGAIINRLYMIITHLTDDSRPLGSFLFSGPTGVGKTELAKACANIVYGNDHRMIRFDMSEFARDDSVDSFRKSLSAMIWENPSSIVLLDEFEKASATCARLMLQVLDDAELTDQHGRPVSFKNSLIIMTTNGAAKVYQEFNQNNANNQTTKLNASDEQLFDTSRTSQELITDYQQLIQRRLTADKSFPPELLGRINEIVPFNPLQGSTRRKITKLRLAEFSKLVEKNQNAKLHIDPKVIRLIADEKIDADTNAGGGRLINRRIDNMISGPIARFIALHPDVRNIAVTVVGQFSDLYNKEGSARIHIAPWAGSRNVIRADV